MSENKKNSPETELNDDALDKVTGGKTKIINGVSIRVCDRCERPLPSWFQGNLCDKCKLGNH